MASASAGRPTALLILAGALVAGGAALVLAWPAGLEDAEPRDAIRDELSPSPATAPTTAAAVIIARCVDRHTSTPIAGCEVFLSAQEDAPGVRPTRPERLGPFTSDGEGRVRIEPTTTGWHCALFLRADGFVPATRDLTPSQATGGDLGDIRLRRGTRVVGRVIDTGGVPQPGVSLGAGHFEDQDRWRSGAAHSAADGTFDLGCLLPGSYGLSVGYGRALRSPLTFEVDADKEAMDVTVTLFSEAEVPINEGVVVDDEGQPLAGVRLMGKLMFADNMVTDANGRFRHVVGPASEPRVHYYPEVEGYEWVDGMETVWPAGSRAIEFRMRRVPSRSLDLRVVDGTTDNPVEAFEAVCIERPARFVRHEMGWMGRVHALGSHQDGRVRLEGLTPDTTAVVVRSAGDPALVAFAELAPGASELTVRTPAAGERTIELVGAAGAPIADSLVELLLPLDDRPLSSDSNAIADLRSWTPYLDSQHAVTVHAVRSDATGRAVLRGPLGRPLVVRVVGRGHVPTLLSPVTLAGRPIRVLVRAGGTLVGRLPAALRAGLGDVAQEPPESYTLRFMRSPQWPEALGYACAQDPDGYGLTLVTEHHAPGLTDVGLPEWKSLPSLRHVFAVGPDGNFRIEGIEPGKWRIRLSLPTRDGFPNRLELGTLANLRDGETRSLQGTAHLEPAVVTGVVTVDGVPFADRVVGFTPTSFRSGLELFRDRITCETDPAGRFAVRLLAGRWQAAVVARGVPTDDHAAWISLPTQVEVQPGVAQVADITFSRRRITFRLLDAAQTPLPFLRVNVRVGSDRLDVLADCDGRFVLDPFATDATTVHLRADAGSASAPVPDEPRDPIVDVVLTK